MLTDTHCHLYKEYYNDIVEIIKESELKNVNRLINNGCDSKSNKEVLMLVNKYKNMYGALGIHPENVLDYKYADLKFIEDNLNNPKILAIGEIGLDYHYNDNNKEEQIKLFEQQLEIAQKYNKPVIIHSRDATKDTIDTLKKYKVKGIIHSFSGSVEDAKNYINMGFLLGVNGIITFEKADIIKVIDKIPLEYLLLETDSPYLTPVPFRGKQNNPSHIYEIALFLANLKNTTIKKIAEKTNENINKLFKI